MLDSDKLKEVVGTVKEKLPDKDKIKKLADQMTGIMGTNQLNLKTINFNRIPTLSAIHDTAMLTAEKFGPFYSSEAATGIIIATGQARPTIAG